MAAGRCAKNAWTLNAHRSGMVWSLPACSSACERTHTVPEGENDENTVLDWELDDETLNED